METNPFNYLEFGISNNAALRATVNSGYNLLMTIGVIGLLLTFILIGIKLMSSNPGKRAEALDDMKWKALIAIILFSIPTLIGTIMRVVASFA